MPKKAAPTPPDAQADTAHQIWLAGLGAFSQAQKQGSEALQKMLQDGLDMQRQAQQTAEQKNRRCHGQDERHGPATGSRQNRHAQERRAFQPLGLARRAV